MLLGKCSLMFHVDLYRLLNSHLQIMFSRQDNSVIIQWDSDTSNILGFRVVYRLFGDKSFKQGPPLESTEREFKIKNVPTAECIVVCVVSLEDITVTPDNVPYHQCREVRTVTAQASNMDKITIAASAAICGTIIVAVIIFIAASRYVTCLPTSLINCCANKHDINL